MSNNKKDVIAIGNAMVDVFIKSNLEKINEYGLKCEVYPYKTWVKF